MTKRNPPTPRLFAVGGRSEVARVRRYVDRQIKAQRALGQLEPVDDGLVGVVMTMADVIDSELSTEDRSAYVILTGLARLVPVLLELRGERASGGDGAVDIELESIAAAVRDAARSDPPNPR